MNVPYSPIGQHPMKLWMTIPLDWRRPKVSKSYDLFWSDRSQYGMLYPRPNPAEVAEYYDVADYYTHDKTVATSNHEKIKPSFMAWLLKRVSWEVDDSVYIENDWFGKHYDTPGRALDLGCGSGKILLRFRREGYEVVGVDPDPTAREVAASRGLEVLNGTAEAPPSQLNGEQFDTVIMTHTLEHCIDPVQAMHNAVNLLKPGGKLVVETPNNLALGFQKAGSAWRWLDVPRHLNFFTPQSLRQMCELAGLQPVATEFRGYSRQFTMDWIIDEQRIWDRYKAYFQADVDLPKRNSEWQAWKLFRRTMFASDEQKYDSVRVIATKV